MFALYRKHELKFGRQSKEVIIPTLFGVVAGIYLLIVLYSSWYTVGKGEQAVEQQLGAYHRSNTPGGPYFKLPWPFMNVTKVDIQTVFEIPIGFRFDKAGKVVEIPEEAEVLTGDMNTVMIDSVLQYQRTDAKKWLFTSDDPERKLFLLAQSALRRAVAARNFDQILTTDRPAAQSTSEARIREILERIGLGARIVAHQIQDTHPPKEVVVSFQDVMNAHENRQRFIEQAEGYRNERLAKSAGEAKKLVEDATGYKNGRINEAKGAAARFDLVYAEYKRAPDLTRDRMRLEALEVVLAGKAQIVDMTGSGGQSPLLKFMDVGAAATRAVATPDSGKK